MILLILSRFMALLSNMVTMTHYGVNLYMDIYSYAVQFPNLIFSSFGTSLTTVVIPIFARHIGTGRKEEAYNYAHNIITISLLFTAALALFGIGFSPYILKLTRFKTEGYDFAVFALRIMFPVVIFYGLNYILQGMLQSLGKFTMPSLVSAVSNFIIIFYIFFIGDKYGIKGLLIITFIALSSQAIILIPPLLSTGYRFKPLFQLNNRDVKTAFKLIPNVLVAGSAYQLMLLFNITVLANFEDSVAVVTMVQNLILSVTLTFIYAITTVLFPRFTILIAQGKLEELKRNMKRTVGVILFVLIPLTAGIVATKFQIIDFFYGWGKFTSDNVEFASSVLALYSLGIAGIGVKEVFVRVFYSFKDTKTPALIEVVTVAVNVLSILLLIKPMGVWSIPIAHSLSSLVGGVLSTFMINKKIGVFTTDIRKVKFVVKIIASSIIMFLSVNIIGNQLRIWPNYAPHVQKALELFIPVVTGVVVYFICACLFRIDIALEFLAKLKAFGVKKGARENG